MSIEQIAMAVGIFLTMTTMVGSAVWAVATIRGSTRELMAKIAELSNKIERLDRALEKMEERLREIDRRLIQVEVTTNQEED